MLARHIIVLWFSLWFMVVEIRIVTEVSGQIIISRIFTVVLFHIMDVPDELVIIFDTLDPPVRQRKLSTSTRRHCDN